ncbi:MAG: hypothetical protein ACR2PT_07335 [Endozoicomonas sp.]
MLPSQSNFQRTALSRKLGAQEPNVLFKELQEGCVNGRKVTMAEAKEIRGHFSYSRSEAMKKIAKESFIGARAVGKTGLKVGAIAGAIAGVVTGLAAAVSFPPSLIALGISAAVGAAKGTVIGGLAGAALGGAVRGGVTALYLLFTTPEKRLQKAAGKGATRLKQLQDKLHSSMKGLKEAEKKEYEHLMFHVPLWQGAADKLGKQAAESAATAV